MPALVGLTRSAAIDSITALNRRGALDLRFSERGANGAQIPNVSAVVDSQRPPPGTVLSPQDSVQLILGNPARALPPAAQMPSVLGLGYAAAMDTLRKLNVRIAAREVDDEALDTAKSRVVNQQPAAGALLASRAEVSVLFSNGGIPLWWWPAGALSLFTIVAAASTIHVKRARARVETMHIEPHMDAGTPRFLSADDAFARLGMSIETVTDAGTQRFHLSPTPPARNETVHV